MHCFRHNYFITDATNIAVLNAMANGISDRLAYRLYRDIGHCTFD